MVKVYLFLSLAIAFSALPNHHITIHHKGAQTYQIKKEKLFSKDIGYPFYEADRVEELMDEIDVAISKSPVNAYIDNQGAIVDGVNGYKLHRGAFRENLIRSLYLNSSNWIQPDITIVYPKVNAELLSSIRKKQVGGFVTYFRKGNLERTKNIMLAAEAINNTVVFPGETFSFNQTVGKRTKEKGYLPAPIIVKGELSEGIGGGICQVSSTLFNAVDQAGVHILERYSHSRSVPYVRPGRDATVSWYGPDFSFRNEFNQPILIRAKVIEDSVVIHVYSSEDM